jgi:hypothetical protein
MQTIAIIPARGGSKRIPRKKIRPFCGKPMIARSIEAALESGVFDAVVVSFAFPFSIFPLAPPSREMLFAIVQKLRKCFLLCKNQVITS